MNLRLAHLILPFFVIALVVGMLPVSAPAAGRITGGAKVDRAGYDARWRSIVSIREGFDPASAAGRIDPSESRWSREDHECGGTLIAPSWVLTAAHCIESSSRSRIAGEGFQVLVGARRLVDTGTQPGRVVAVDDVVVHPDWDGSSHDDEDYTDDGGGSGWDAALLHLAVPVTDVPATPIVGASEQALWGAGAGLASGALVAGWGASNATYYDFDDDVADDTQSDLREVALPLLADARCASSDSPIASGAIDFDAATMLCGYATGSAKLRMDRRKGACFGDSGGPLLVDDRAGGWRLAGIVSWGPEDDGGCNRASVFTRVDAMRGWIQSTMTQTATPLAATPPADVRGVVTGAGAIRLGWSAPVAPSRRLVVLRQVSLYELVETIAVMWQTDVPGLIRMARQWDEEGERTASDTKRPSVSAVIARMRLVPVLTPIGVAGSTSDGLRINKLVPRRPGSDAVYRVRVEAQTADGRRVLGPLSTVPAPVDSAAPSNPGAPRVRYLRGGLTRLAWRPISDDDCVVSVTLQLRRAGRGAWQSRPVDSYGSCAWSMLGGGSDGFVQRAKNAMPDTAASHIPVASEVLYGVRPGRYAVRIVARDRAGNRVAGPAVNVRVRRQTRGSGGGTTVAVSGTTTSAGPGVATDVLDVIG